MLRASLQQAHRTSWAAGTQSRILINLKSRAGTEPLPFAVRAQDAGLQEVRAQTAGYHRRDLDALREAAARYAQLDPPARAAYVASLSSVLASLQWCGPRVFERPHTQPVRRVCACCMKLATGWARPHWRRRVFPGYVRGAGWWHAHAVGSASGLTLAQSNLTLICRGKELGEAAPPAGAAAPVRLPPARPPRFASHLERRAAPAPAAQHARPAAAADPALASPAAARRSHPEAERPAAPHGAGNGASPAPAVQSPAAASWSGSIPPDTPPAAHSEGVPSAAAAVSDAAAQAAAEASSSRSLPGREERAGGEAAGGPRAAPINGTAWPYPDSPISSSGPPGRSLQDHCSRDARATAGVLNGAHTGGSASVLGALNGARDSDPPPWELPAERFSAQAPMYSVEVDKERRQIRLRPSAPEPQAAPPADASFAAIAPPALDTARGAASAGALAAPEPALPRSGFSRVEPAAAQRASVGADSGGSSDAARQLAALPERPRVFVFDTETTGTSRAAPAPRH